MTRSNGRGLEDADQLHLPAGCVGTPVIQCCHAAKSIIQVDENSIQSCYEEENYPHTKTVFLYQTINTVFKGVNVGIAPLGLWALPQVAPRGTVVFATSALAVFSVSMLLLASKCKKWNYSKATVG